jgi:hypothetical protein
LFLIFDSLIIICFGIVLFKLNFIGELQDSGTCILISLSRFEKFSVILFLSKLCFYNLLELFLFTTKKSVLTNTISLFVKIYVDLLGP